MVVVVVGVRVACDHSEFGAVVLGSAHGFGGVEPEATGRPAYPPATLLKIYVYGYLNRVQSSRRLERECQRNIELVWLTGRLMPDFKTIADFRKGNREAIRRVCREFVVLCRRLELFSEASVAIDGSKFKAVNTRDRNFTQAKMQRRLAQISLHGELSARLRRGLNPGRAVDTVVVPFPFCWLLKAVSHRPSYDL
jgi:transposase